MMRESLSDQASRFCHSRRFGFSILEIIVALTIATMFAMTGLAFVQTHGETAKSRACEANRSMLQRDVELYESETGRLPSRTLRELADEDYSGVNLPTCPVSGAAYGLDQGDVICPTHGK
ncbi:MAG: competence type IV pilus major pilin ComGC [Rhodopirellula sp. JB055]|uniref:competence type IV pilus major pilin ComGC n=1 Tax=Rhodopirellula sp. JB055 TaxID=3342846 RepID=UPI00370C441F